MIIEHDGEQYIKLTALYDAVQKPVIMAPFNGAMLPVIVRELTHTQIRACGDFSLIETIADAMMKAQRSATVDEAIKYSELQYNILQKALVSPSYDEIMSLNKYDVLRIEAEKELKEIEDLLNSMSEGPKRNELMVSYNAAVMASQYLLPSDFVSFVVGFALGIDKSDIKDITEDMLFEAAYKATRGHDNPADHLHGTFSDFNREDINSRAWILFHERSNKK